MAAASSASASALSTQERSAPASQLYHIIHSAETKHKVGSVFSGAFTQKISPEPYFPLAGKRCIDLSKPIALHQILGSAMGMTMGTGNEILANGVVKQLCGGKVELYALFDGHEENGFGALFGVEKLPEIVERALDREGVSVETAIRDAFLFFDRNLNETLKEYPKGGCGLLMVLKFPEQVYIASVGHSRAYLHQVVKGKALTYPLNFQSNNVLGIKGQNLPEISLTRIERGVDTKEDESTQTAQLGYNEKSLLILGSRALADTISEVDLNDGLEGRPSCLDLADIALRTIVGTAEAHCELANCVMVIQL